MKESNKYTLQDVFALSFDTLKDTSKHLGSYISKLDELKKYTVTIEIIPGWGQMIKEEEVIFLRKQRI